MGNCSSSSPSCLLSSLQQYNQRPLSFDLPSHVADRHALARDLREIATDAASHRRLTGHWQMVQGTAGVTTGLMVGGMTLMGAGATLPVAAAATAVLATKSLTAAGMASSAAFLTHKHVMDKEMTCRLRNLQHIIESLAERDLEINPYFAVRQARESDADDTNWGAGMQSTKWDKYGKNDDVKDIDQKDTWQLLQPTPEQKATEPPMAIRACHDLVRIWKDFDLDDKETKQIRALDFALALAQSSGLVTGVKSLWDGHVQAEQPHALLETALLQTAAALECETRHIVRLDLRYLRCIPAVPSSGGGHVPRGQLKHVDGGNGQVTMMVSFCRMDNDKNESDTITLRSDNTTRRIRLPYGARGVRVTFQDAVGKPVYRVHRADPQQPWVKDPDNRGKRVLEECCLDHADGADIIFVVKGFLTHAYIHKAWDFGREGRRRRPREWEWWGDASHELVPALVEQAQDDNPKDDDDFVHANSCSSALWCIQRHELIPFSNAGSEIAK